MCAWSRYNMIPNQINLRDTEVLLDNQASRGIFKNQNLIHNLRLSNEITLFKGISGTIKTNKVADVPNLGTLSYMPECIANILSFAEIEDNNGIKYIPKVGFLVTTSNGVEYFFKRRNNLYICDFAEKHELVMFQK
jgi:hypothetical protein